MICLMHMGILGSVKFNNINIRICKATTSMFERKTLAVQGRVKIVNCTYTMDIHCHT